MKEQYKNMKRFILLLLLVAGFMIVASGNCLASTNRYAFMEESHIMGKLSDEVKGFYNQLPLELKLIVDNVNPKLLELNDKGDILTFLGTNKEKLATIKKNVSDFTFEIDFNSSIGKRLKVNNQILKVRNLQKDIVSNPVLLKELSNDLDLVDNWRLLDDGGRKGLKLDLASIKSLKKIRNNPNRLDIGLTDDVLKNIEGHYEPFGFKEVIDDLDKLASFYGKNPGTKFNDFNKTLNQLKKTSSIRKRKGAHGVIKEIIENSNDYKGKTLSFEKEVPNARPTNQDSRVDIRIEGDPPKDVEVKWMTREISEGEIVTEFIERDLYNATNINDIKWVQINTKKKLTQEQFVKFLSSEKGREALQPLLINGKLQKFFPNDKIKTVDNFINKLNNESLFKSIFK